MNIMLKRFVASNQKPALSIKLGIDVFDEMSGKEYGLKLYKAI